VRGFGPATAPPAPAFALNATDEPFTVMVDLDERSLAAGAGIDVITH